MDKEWKCFEILCARYPKCRHAAGSCCALDDFFEDVTLTPEMCFELPDKPYYEEKKRQF